MAQTENGVGVSYKLADGTMVWARRDTYAELTEDIGLIFGPEALARLEEQTHRAWGGNKPQPRPVVTAKGETLSPEQVEQVMRGEAPQLSVVEDEPEQSFETCPRCGGLKDRWVPPGTSKKAPFKPYPGFWGCSTPRCPGR